MKKLLAAAFTASTLFSLNAHAAPASAASVNELLVITKSEAMIDAMYVQIDQMMKTTMAQAMGDLKLTDEQQKRSDAAMADTQKLFREEMSWQKLKPDFIRIYSESLEQEDIDGLLVFYKSKTGQAFINKMPVVMQKTMDITQAKMMVLMPKINAKITAIFDDTKAAK